MHYRPAIKQGSLQFSSEVTNRDVMQLRGDWQADSSTNEVLLLRNCDCQMCYVILAQSVSNCQQSAADVGQCLYRGPTYGRLSGMSVSFQAVIWKPVQPAWIKCVSEAIASRNNTEDWCDVLTAAGHQALAHAMRHAVAFRTYCTCQMTLSAVP